MTNISKLLEEFYAAKKKSTHFSSFRDCDERIGRLLRIASRVQETIINHHDTWGKLDGGCSVECSELCRLLDDCEAIAGNPP